MIVKTIKYILLAFLSCNIVQAQDSLVNVQTSENIRSSKPLFVFFDSNGLGFGYSIFRIVDLQASSMILTSEASAKIYLTGGNSTPFIGYGIGNEYQGFGGNGQANDWKLAFIGFQYHPFPDKGLFLAVMYQYVLEESNKNAEWPTTISFNLGIRFL